MPIYYVNNKAQLNGDHEVHKAGCTWMPSDKKISWGAYWLLYCSRISKEKFIPRLMVAKPVLMRVTPAS